MATFIDLTITLEHGMPGVETHVAREIHKDGWNATTFHLYSHCGTHMDAPLHFGVNDGCIDEILVERFFVDCWLIDLRSIGDNELITVQNVRNIADKVKRGEGLIFYTGWSKYLGTDRYRDNLPRISVELAEWCVEKKIGLIGVEPPSIADVNNIKEVTTVHQIILKEGIMIVEGLTNLDKISKEKFKLVALPLKIKSADGAPARVIAIEE